jgi:diaminohydroxyphosphoribosylaminopyrimidine deaminase/5-amino-6-(5-phosphoribosylamino)uracil reductase
MGMMSLLVEGGSEVNGSFLDERLIDKVFLFVSPKFLGGPALGIFGGKGTEKLEKAFSLNLIKIKKAGDDILLEGYPKKACSQEL